MSGFSIIVHFLSPQSFFGEHLEFLIDPFFLPATLTFEELPLLAAHRRRAQRAFNPFLFHSVSLRSKSTTDFCQSNAERASGGAFLQMAASVQRFDKTKLVQLSWPLHFPLRLLAVLISETALGASALHGFKE